MTEENINLQVTYGAIIKNGKYEIWHNSNNTFKKVLSSELNTPDCDVLTISINTSGEVKGDL